MVTVARVVNWLLSRLLRVISFGCYGTISIKVKEEISKEVEEDDEEEEGESTVSP